MKSRVVMAVTGLFVVAAAGGTALIQGQKSGAELADYCATLKEVLEPPAADRTPQERFERVGALTAELAKRAPDAVAADAATYASGVQVFVVELSQVGFDFTKLSAERMGQMQTSEMVKAASTVMASASADCNLSTGSAAPSSASARQPGPEPEKSIPATSSSAGLASETPVTAPTG